MISYEKRGDLWIAYSDSHELRGLLVTGRSREEVDQRLPRAIKELQDASSPAPTEDTEERKT